MKLQILSIALAVSTMCSAQTAREEIHENILLTGSNHVAYIAPTKKLTPAPKGYEPFYMDHYGRHGSRWLIDKPDYTNPLEKMRKAKEDGKLTPLGLEVLEKLERFYPTTINRLGELSDIGEQQHHQIGKRMTENFPEIFAGKTAELDARSTVVIRCILSMEAECEELAAFNPNLKIHNDVSESLQYYLNRDWDETLKEAVKPARKIIDEYKERYTHPERLCSTLFNDSAYWQAKDFRAGAFMRALFKVGNNMQSHSFGEDIYSVFTEEEAYDQWRAKNIEWYLRYGPSPVTGSIMPFSQRYLLRNMIETADTVFASKTYTNGASLRFGHEVCVMPLACLMELDSCGVKTYDLDNLENYWVNYRIYPMACNIQMVFYRPKKTKVGQLNVDDILVKVLLNEKEAKLPVFTDNYPYYKWSDLRKYYINKLDSYVEKKNIN